MEILSLGLHPRCGNESPIHLIDGDSFNMIRQYTLLMTMISDAPPREKDLTKVCHIFLNQPTPFSQIRMQAYLKGQQEAFLNQSAHVLLCSNCEINCYLLGYLEKSPQCPQCHASETILRDISVREIPMDINIDTYYWYEESWDMFFPIPVEPSIHMYGHTSVYDFTQSNWLLYLDDDN